MRRYILNEVEGLPNHYMVEDCQSGIVCMFEKGKFNDTQELGIYHKTI